jgi:hypothetical protein
MTKQTVKGFMFMEYESDWAHGDYCNPKWWARWREFKPEDSETRIFIREMDVEFDVPDDFDPIPKQVAALEAEKRAALAEYQSKVADINERLSKLQAITYDPEAV